MCIVLYSIFHRKCNTHTHIHVCFGVDVAGLRCLGVREVFDVHLKTNHASQAKCQALLGVLSTRCLKLEASFWP